jgi:hypothetical protein
MAENENGGPPKRNAAYDFLARMELEHQGIERAKRRILAEQEAADTRGNAGSLPSTPRSVPVIEPLRGTGASGVLPALQPLAPDEMSRWHFRTLWHINATAFLLHGYRPHDSISPPDRPELKEAYEDLRIAIRAHELQQNLKGELRRDEVIRWAANRPGLYPNFPFANFESAMPPTTDAHVVKLLTLTEENSRLKEELRDAKAEARRLRDEVERWQADALAAADRSDTNGREADRLRERLAQLEASALRSLNPEHEYFCRALAAAVAVCEARPAPAVAQGNKEATVRGGIEQWLRAHRGEYGAEPLTDTEVTRIVDLVNWDRQSGRRGAGRKGD